MFGLEPHLRIYAYTHKRLMRNDYQQRLFKLEKEMAERGKVIEKLRATIEYFSPQLPAEFLEKCRPVLLKYFERNCVSKFDLNKMRKYYGEKGALAKYKPPMRKPEKIDVSIF